MNKISDEIRQYEVTMFYLNKLFDQILVDDYFFNHLLQILFQFVLVLHLEYYLVGIYISHQQLIGDVNVVHILFILQEQ